MSIWKSFSKTRNSELLYEVHTQTFSSSHYSRKKSKAQAKIRKKKMTNLKTAVCYVLLLAVDSSCNAKPEKAYFTLFLNLK